MKTEFSITLDKFRIVYFRKNDHNSPKLSIYNVSNESAGWQDIDECEARKIITIMKAYLEDAGGN